MKTQYLKRMLLASIAFPFSLFASSQDALFFTEKCKEYYELKLQSTHDKEEKKGYLRKKITLTKALLNAQENTLHDVFMDFSRNNQEDMQEFMNKMKDEVQNTYLKFKDPEYIGYFNLIAVEESFKYLCTMGQNMTPPSSELPVYEKWLKIFVWEREGRQDMKSPIEMLPQIEEVIQIKEELGLKSQEDLTNLFICYLRMQNFEKACEIYKVLQDYIFKNQIEKDKMCLLSYGALCFFMQGDDSHIQCLNNIQDPYALFVRVLLQQDKDLNAKSKIDKLLAKHPKDFFTEIDTLKKYLPETLKAEFDKTLDSLGLKTKYFTYRFLAAEHGVIALDQEALSQIVQLLYSKEASANLKEQILVFAINQFFSSTQNKDMERVSIFGKILKKYENFSSVKEKIYGAAQDAFNKGEFLKEKKFLENLIFLLDEDDADLKKYEDFWKQNAKKVLSSDTIKNIIKSLESGLSRALERKKELAIRQSFQWLKLYREILQEKEPEMIQIMSDEQSVQMERVYRFFVGVGNYTGAKKVIALFPQKDILNRLHDHFIERKDTNFQGDSSPMTVFLSYVLDPEKEFTPVTVDLKEIDFLKRFFDCDVLNARINKVLGKKRSRKKVKRKEKEKNSSESNTSVTKIESLGSFDFIDDLSKPKNTDNIITDSFSNLLPKFDETVNEEIKVIDLKTGSHEDEASLSNEIDKKYENSANNSLDSSTEDLSPEFENFCSPDSFKKSYSKEEIIELEKTEDFKRFLERKFGK